MYTPLQVGIPRKFKQAVLYRESSTAPAVAEMVHCWWRLQTTRSLIEDFTYLILPDGCVDIVFDVGVNPLFAGAVIMTPATTATKVDLGRQFSFVGIRLRPGAWRAAPGEIVGQTTFVEQLAGVNLVALRRQLLGASAEQQQEFLQKFVVRLASHGFIGRSLPAEAVLRGGDTAVAGYAEKLGYSRRHAQRIFRECFGYSPHNFIKIVRFQASLRDQDFAAYADQSHYIREFKRITGMTPGAFQAAYE